MNFRFNYLLLTLCLSVLISSCKNYDEIPCLPFDLRTNVCAFYSFNNGSLLDKSLEGNNLTVHGSPIPTSDRFNNKECAFQFNRNNGDYLTAEGSFLNNYHNKEFSISLWYQPTDTIFGSTYFKHDVLISRDTSQFNNCGSRVGQWSVSLIDCGTPALRIDQSILYSEQIIPDTIIDNSCYTFAKEYSKSWIHLVGTFQNNKLNLFINGVPSLEQQITFQDCTKSINFGNLFLGYRFTGNLDDIIIFNKQLSENEVTQLFVMDPCCE